MGAEARVRRTENYTGGVLKKLGLSLLVLGAFSQFSVLVPYWWWWLSFAGAILAWLTGLVFLLVAADRSYRPKEESSAKISIPSEWFMPSCVCPSCGKEAMHWMRTPRTTREDFTFNEWNKAFTSMLRRYTFTRPHAELIEHQVFQKEKGFEVFRTCRFCDHEWGQNSITVWSGNSLERAVKEAS